MPIATPRPTFLSLPTEIRFHIAASALDQGPHGGRKPNPWGLDFAPEDEDKRPENVLDEPYRSSANLQILLVCRQFRHDFTPPAWESTTFELFLEGHARMGCRQLTRTLVATCPKGSSALERPRGINEMAFN